MTQLDPDVWLKVHATLDRARRLGTDPGEELFRAGLLLTPEHQKYLYTQGMQFLLKEICSWRPAEFLRMKFLPHHSASPTDMYSCIVEFIERHLEQARKR